MKALLVIMMIVASLNAPKNEGSMYDVWNQTGLHLMMHDNGTPEDRSHPHKHDVVYRLL